MATNYKVLGQSAPASATLATLYAVPAATQAVVSTIVACNLQSVDADVRIAVRPAGASIQSQHYLFYDTTVEGNSTVALTLGITLDATDVVSVYGSAASVVFNAFGSEITA